MFILFTLISCGPILAQQRTPAPAEFVNWLPISPAEQQLKSPKVEPDAGAEVLEWRVHVVDELLGDNRDLQRVFYNYVRLKIFDEKGKEKAATIDLPYGDHRTILDVAGRTVKADGSVVELDKKAVYKRDLVRAGGRKLKGVSFAMPAVEPGVIIEYRWREIEDDNRFRYLRMPFQREFPVERVTYYVKPLPGEVTGGEQMFMSPFNCRTSPLLQEKDGSSSTFVENVPALHDEIFSPSESNLSEWALLRYQKEAKRDPEKYWGELGRHDFKELRESAKANDEIKSAAAEAVSGAKNDDEKIVALIQTVRAHVRNVFASDVTEAERAKFFKTYLKDDRRRTAADIYKSGLGTPNEMNVVFAAMVQQEGLDARPARVADREEFIFNPKYGVTMDEYFLDNVDIAVNQGGSWKLYDVSTKRLPPGMISWREEGMFALITDSKTPTFIQTPSAPPEASSELRVGKLKLLPTGELEGDVEENTRATAARNTGVSLNGNPRRSAKNGCTTALRACSRMRT